MAVRKSPRLLQPGFPSARPLQHSGKRLPAPCLAPLVHQHSPSHCPEAAPEKKAPSCWNGIPMTLPFRKDSLFEESSLFTSATSTRRILAIWLPHLATDRILRQRHGTSWRQAGGKSADGIPPLVLSHREDNTQRISAMNEAAEALGLRKGLGIADARAMHPALEILDADPVADWRMLGHLADWCDHFTPLVALDGADGLMLDISGCAHLFGGEDSLLREVLRRLGIQGFD